MSTRSTHPSPVRVSVPVLALSTLVAVPLALATPAEVLAPDAAPAKGVAWTRGGLAVESLGALAFGPAGILFAADHEGAAIVALKVGAPAKTSAAASTLEVKDVDEVLAYLLGTTRDDVRINDLAVQPGSGTAYLSVTRGGGADTRHVLVAVHGPEEFEVLELGEMEHQRASLDDAPAPDSGGRRSQRAQSITDLVFHDGTLYVAGLSNEEFASKLRALDFPFQDEGGAEARSANIEIYHGAHGAWETRAPVRAMIAMELAGEDTLMCGYTCTPLVRVPVAQLEGADKFVGTTVAELGNRNTPLDMVAYEKDGEGFLLIANSARGLMKLATAGLESAEGITTRVNGTGGHPYETVAAFGGVRQLAPLDGQHALVVLERKGGVDLETIALP